MALIILIMRQIPKIYTSFSNFLYFLQIRIQNIILTTNELNHYHLFKKNVLWIYWMKGPRLDARDAAVNKTNIPVLMRETDSKQDKSAI